MMGQEYGMVQILGGIYILPEDQNNLDVKSDCLQKFSVELDSVPIDLDIVSRKVEHPGQRSFGLITCF